MFHARTYYFKTIIIIFSLVHECMKEREWMSFEKLCVLLSRLFILQKDQRFQRRSTTWTSRARRELFLSPTRRFLWCSSCRLRQTAMEKTNAIGLNKSFSSCSMKSDYLHFSYCACRKRNQLILLSVTSSKVCFISEKPTGSSEIAIEPIFNTLMGAPV